MKQQVEVYYGPQHPGTHPFSILLKLDGDIIIDAEPKIGYVHRAIEKLAEYRDFYQNIPIMERACFLEDLIHEHGYMIAAEKLLGVEIPERAEYLRVITAELSRIISLLMWFSMFGGETGLSTTFMWGFTDREKLLDIMTEITGARVAFAYFLPGGVRWDFPEGIEDKLRKYLDYQEEQLDVYKGLLMDNSIFIDRTKGVGVADPDTLIKLGASGPVLRASGFKYDLRVDAPYGVYDHFKIDTPVLHNGDSYDRTMIRLMDIKTSIDIVRQALDQLPSGDVRVKVRSKKKAAPGAVYSRVESARGILGYYIISNGTNKPYRIKIRGPSFSHMYVFPHLIRGLHLADVPMVLGTLDVCPADLDR